MPIKQYKILFICTGNSARSIMAEVITNRLGFPHFKAYSAGRHPRGEIHPLTLKVLQNIHREETQYDLSFLRSKGCEQFALPSAPQMDFIFTVCDRAAGEKCLPWPGHPVTAHWGFPDPAAVTGDEITRMKAFLLTRLGIEQRIRLFLTLPFDQLDRLALQKEVDELGKQRFSLDELEESYSEFPLAG